MGVVTIFELSFVFVLERFFGELLFERGALKAALEFVAFFLDRARVRRQAPASG